jgi:cytidylate kinase
MIIAIDGPAASGKGTVARRVAATLGFAYLDTGLIYRAVARDVLAEGASLDDEAAATRAAESLDPTTLDDPGLKAPGVGEAASIVAKVASVRRALLEFQRAFAARPPGAVLDGRDIGTVVCPDADLKLFVTADVEVRARRRYDELLAKGEDVSFERVLDTIRRRDARDSGRADAPMLAAPDSIRIDTTHLAVDHVVAEVLALVAAKGRS